MANCKELVITGRIPFDCDRHHDLCRYLGQMNGPSFGYRITYGKESLVPNDHGGQTTLYDFTIQGVEAVSSEWIAGLLQALINAGADLDVGKWLVYQDIDGPQTLRLPIPKKQAGQFVAEVRITVENPEVLDKAEPWWTVSRALEGKLTAKLVGSEGGKSAVMSHPNGGKQGVWVQAEIKPNSVQQA